MKSSTIILIILVVSAVGMLTIHNFSLRASYLKGSYKDKFNHHTFTACGQITELNLISPDLDVNIEPGLKEGVWVDDRLKDLVRVTYKEGVVNIGLVKDNKGGFYKAGFVTVIARKLSRLNLNPVVSAEQGKHGYQGTAAILTGLDADSLAVQMGRSTFLSLEKVQLKAFSVVVGDKVYGGSSLKIDSHSSIGYADISVPGNSRISLGNPKIVKAVYNISDSATLEMNGAAIKSIKDR